ncbi:hypothetical protein JCM8097_000048 [Rhodosporidiobolus ruineniae]
MSGNRGAGGNRRAFEVQYRQFQGRKNKSWESDGYLFIDGQKLSIMDENGKQFGQKTLSHPLQEGDEFSHGMMDFRVDSEMELSEYYKRVSGGSQLGTPAAPAKPGYFSRPGSASVARTPAPASRAYASPASAAAQTPDSVGKTWQRAGTGQKAFKPLVAGSAIKRSPSVEASSARSRSVETPVQSRVGGSKLKQQVQPSSAGSRASDSGKGKGKEREPIKPEEDEDDDDDGHGVENTPPSSQNDHLPPAKKRRVDSSTCASSAHAGFSKPIAPVPQRTHSVPRPASKPSAADAALAKSLSRTTTASSSSSTSVNGLPSRPPSRPKPWEALDPAPAAGPSRAQPRSLFRSPPPAGPSPVKAAVKPELVDDDDVFGVGAGSAAGMELDAGMFADLDELEAELGADEGDAAREEADDSGCFEAPMQQDVDEEEAEEESGTVPPRREERTAGRSRMEEKGKRKMVVKDEEEDEEMAVVGEEEEQEEVKPVVVKSKRRYFTCQWRKRSTKKQAVYEGDGLLTIKGEQAELKDLDSDKRLYAGRFPAGVELENGAVVTLGQHIDREIDSPNDLASSSAPAPPPPRPAPAQFKPPALASVSTSNTFKPFNAPGAAKATNPLAAAQVRASASPQKASSSQRSSSSSATTSSTAGTTAKPKAVASTSFFGANAAVVASKYGPPATSGPRPGKAVPKFDPNKEGAVVMQRPNEEHQKEYNKKGLPVVDVVIDPILGDKLRPHQKDGVRFMYECVMGMRTAGQGCILADDMGLGKTIQSIALVYTLLRQNPYYSDGTGAIQRAMIVCPVTLLKNWSAEIKKWLGKNRIEVFVADGNNQLSTFAKNRRYEVLIVGYEKLRDHVDDVKYAQPPIGLIICDEGHRLKSAGAKVTKSLQTLSCMRRVILSGTPIQNNLGEFFAMMDFVSPGILKDSNYFKKHFEVPITRARQPNASKREKEEGRQASELLSEIQRNFVLRRTNEVNQQNLPPKQEYAVFILPTALECELYRQVITSSTVIGLLEGHGRREQLSTLTYLRKLVNTPGLLMQEAQSDKGVEGLGEELAGLLPKDIDPADFALSAKFSVLGSFLADLRETSEEKVVVISNFTKTLDIVEKHCKEHKYPTCRLDGSTPQADRIPMVDGFNKGSNKNHFIFLLSSKSGGTGLNIIGASRLIMLDADWNPSTDAQAMARIHREGQTRTCFIYRFFTAGTIDEKVFQRQLTKQSLSSSVMGEEGEAGAAAKGGNTFSSDELRAIFTLHDDTACNTHDLLGCRCHFGETLPDFEEEDEDEADEDDEEGGFLQASQFQGLDMDRRALKQRRNLSVLKTWKHFNCSSMPSIDSMEDPLLRSVVYKRMMVAPDDERVLEPQGENGDCVLRGSQVGWVFGKCTG